MNLFIEAVKKTWNEIRKDLGMGMLNMILLAPAAIFWISMVMFVALGTDYVYDVIIVPMSKSQLGNMLLISLVIGLPIVVTAANGWRYKQTRVSQFRNTAIAGALLAILGIITIVRGI